MKKIDTGTDQLLGRVDDGVAVLTMNRPERRNALSGSMFEGLARALAEVEVDSDVGSVVLTGAGGAFCAGGDVKAMAGEDGGPTAGADGSQPVSVDARIYRQRLMQRATTGRLWQIPKPTIAALPGPAAGAGLSLALACDLRYAVEGAVLTTAFARVGFSGDYGGTCFLTRLVGAAKARELYYFSDRISAREAERLGIVNAVFPEETFEQEVVERARRLAAGPRTAYRYMKENLNRAVGGELGECLDLEATHHIHTGQTEDHREAVRAFVEKREPQFRGR
ncbi:MAG TPA: enoyl-CoA hydratase-related protein [Acidimicrobiales bacterium]|nr:enoyl-CoA hydratase-related protein [Acidimicrobiales bacterium]